MQTVQDILNNECHASIKAFEIELNNGEYEFLEVFGIGFEKLACIGSNCGLIQIDYDYNFSLDMNIQALYDEVINKLLELELI